jgi:alpha 1,3-glucosidase
MWMEYPKTESLFAIDDQYLVGSDLLVKPVTAPGVVETAVKFPTDDIWYDAETLKVVAEKGTPGSFNEITVPSDIDTIPVFQRGGSILARKLRLRRSTHMMTNDPYTLYIALDSLKKATGSIYMDDEVTFDHQIKAEYALATFTADFSEAIATIKNRTVWMSEARPWVSLTTRMQRSWLSENQIFLQSQSGE